MKIDLLTIFPNLFQGFLNESLIGKAISKKLLTCSVHDIRDFAEPPHWKVDDAPYGGGAGMVMKPEPLTAAVLHAKKENPTAPVILLSASGEPFTQKIAHELSHAEGLILVCGRYEGVDQRFIDTQVTREISLGDFVLMGGEVAAMAIIEATIRLQPGILGNADSITEESYSSENQGLLEGPQYTRPALFAEQPIPEVLTSGDHAKIAAWRKTQAQLRTQQRRPDLLKKEKS